MSKMTLCKTCKSQIAASAKVCPSCGAKNKKPLSQRPIFWIVLIVLFLVIIGSTTANNPPAATTVSAPLGTTADPLASSQARTSAPTATPEAVLVVSAKELIAAYDANEVKADTQYKGKLLEVTGIVNDISVVMGTTTVTVGTGAAFEWGISCSFQDSEKEKIAELNKGDSITVSGKCDGKSLSVSMRKCILANTEK